MAAIYTPLWPEFGFLSYTSKPYPIYSEDDLAEEHDITFVGMAGWEPAHLTQDSEFISANLVHVISYTSFDQPAGDYLTQDSEFISADLKQIIDYIEYDHIEPEYLTQNSEFLSADLVHVIGYVFIEQPPDNIVEDHIITGITLTV